MMKFTKYILLSSLLIGCVGDPTVSTSNSTAKGVKGSVFELVPVKSKIYPQQLDDESFRVRWGLVGLASHVRSKSPIIRYNIPTSADYIELSRCRADAAFVKIVQENVLNNKKTEGWDASVGKDNCTALTSVGISQSTYLDATAPTTTTGYRYLVRACVDRERLIGATENTRNCSNYVGVTQTDLVYQNDRQEHEKLAFENVARYREEADLSARRILVLAAQLNNAKAMCVTQKELRDKALRQKQALSKIIGMGISIADSLMGDVTFTSFTSNLLSEMSTSGQKTLEQVASVGQNILGASGNISEKLTQLKGMFNKGSNLTSFSVDEAPLPTVVFDPATSDPSTLGTSTTEPSTSTTSTSERTSTATKSTISLPVTDLKSAVDAMIVAPDAIVAADKDRRCSGEEELNLKIGQERTRLIVAKASYDVMLDVAEAAAKSRASFEGN